MNKRKLIWIIVVIKILLIALFFWFSLEIDSDEIRDGDCVRVELGCCSCANGGEEMCVLKTEAEKIEKNKNCDGNTFCAAVYSCSIKSCRYLNGECIEE